jgi:peptide/nickel transport system ATP-binding protein
MEYENILEVRNLKIIYRTDDGVVEALNGVNLSIAKGKTLGLVGETGAGKTTLAKGIMGLIPYPPGEIISGEILYCGEDLLKFTEKRRRKIRGAEISMIFQDPMTSLNPVMPVGKQIEEVLKEHGRITNEEAKKGAENMLEIVGIPKDRVDEYPHQFSGGMKQRIIIAIALACKPRLLIADEPTTALDVTIQHQVLTLMSNLKREFDTSLLMITHDLGIVAQNCDYVAIMYAGEIVEYGTLHDIFKNYKHPYTEGLFGSIPSLTEDVERLTPIEGQVTDPTKLPKGCKFHPRCKYVQEACMSWDSEMYNISSEHQVRCILYNPERKSIAED